MLPARYAVHCRLLLSILLVSVGTISAVPTGTAQPPHRLRDITVDDAIEMSRPASPEYFVGSDLKHGIAQFSPDKKYFLVVLRKGLVKEGANEYSILLYRTGQALKSPPPQVIARMRSSSNTPAIQTVRWSAGSQSVYFLGCDRSGISQVYEVRIHSREARQLTRHVRSVTDYGVSENGKVFFLALAPREPKLPPMEEQETVVTTQSLISLINPLYSTEDQKHDLFQMVRGKEHQVSLPLSLDPNGLWPSPDGLRLVVSSQLKTSDLPPTWEPFEYPGGAWARGMFHSKFPSQLTPFIRYSCINLRTSKAELLWSGAHWAPSPVAWSSDGTWVYLKQMYIPLDIASSVLPDQRKQRPFDIRLNPTDMRWTLVAPNNWPSSTDQAPLDVELREDINTPPRIYVRKSESSEGGVELLNLNPQFDQLRFGRVEVISWVVHGIPVKAGLYLPPDYSPSRRYPLVIQTHGFNEGRFSMDGMNEWSSGFAARPLASQGIVVLQAYAFADQRGHEEVASDRMLGTNEQQSFRTFASLVYESAIDELNHRGIILPNKVGISGFSRTVWFVAYTLTHARHRFAAAILTDGIDAGYFQYLAFRQSEFDLDNGAMPFGSSGLQEWAKESPGFNLDKVQTPVKLVSLDRSIGILEAWEWFTGLRMLGKPVELAFIPTGTHLLEKVQDRRIVMNGIVSWFRSLLQEHTNTRDSN